jgi:hypothetical protein
MATLAGTLMNTTVLADNFGPTDMPVDVLVG